MSWKSHEFYLKEGLKHAEAAVANNNMPFGAVLVDENGEIILRQENIEITESDCTGHAETQLMVKASKKYDKQFLAKCTLYTTVEPCAMCAGAIYWGNVKRVVFGLSERELLKITGADQQNPTLDLPCREVFKKGQKEIEVIGPIPELKEELTEFYQDFFKN